VLARAGVERIASKAGQAFDPFYHEAIEVRHGEKTKDTTILDVVQSGYVHEGVVLRPARVIVGRSGP
jgi:molecular chaperone GrpE